MGLDARRPEQFEQMAAWPHRGARQNQSARRHCEGRKRQYRRWCRNARPGAPGRARGPAGRPAARARTRAPADPTAYGFQIRVCGRYEAHENQK